MQVAGFILSAFGVAAVVVAAVYVGRSKAKDETIDAQQSTIGALTTRVETLLGKVDVLQAQHDNDSMHSTTSNTSRITAQTAGRYLVFGSVTFDASTTGRRAMQFRVNNGATDYNVVGAHPVQTAQPMAISGVRAVSLNAGDYVELRVVQSSGANLGVTLEEFAVFWMTR